MKASKASPKVGLIYRVPKSLEGVSMNGHWMTGRLLEGDLLLCQAHGYAAIYEYRLLRLKDGALDLIEESHFPAIGILGVPTAWQPSTRDYHLLCAGETIKAPELADEEAKRVRTVTYGD
jgi:hypothetical protein